MRELAKRLTETEEPVTTSDVPLAPLPPSQRPSPELSAIVSPAPVTPRLGVRASADRVAIASQVHARVGEEADGGRGAGDDV